MGTGRLGLGGHQDPKTTKSLFLGMYAVRPGLDIWRGQGDVEVLARCPRLHVPISLCDSPASWVEGRQEAVQEGAAGGVSLSRTAQQLWNARHPGHPRLRLMAPARSQEQPGTPLGVETPPGLLACLPATLLLYRLPETELSLAEPGPKSLFSLPDRTPLICLALLLALRRQPPPPFSPSTPP